MLLGLTSGEPATYRGMPLGISAVGWCWYLATILSTSPTALASGSGHAWFATLKAAEREWERHARDMMETQPTLF